MKLDYINDIVNLDKTKTALGEMLYSSCEINPEKAFPNLKLLIDKNKNGYKVKFDINSINHKFKFEGQSEHEEIIVHDLLTSIFSYLND